MIAGRLKLININSRLQSACRSSYRSEAALNDYIATEQQPIHIESNSSIISITACGKCCNNHDVSEDSDVTALSNKLTNINVNINNNFGIIIITLTAWWANRPRCSA